MNGKEFMKMLIKIYIRKFKENKKMENEQNIIKIVM